MDQRYEFVRDLGEGGQGRVVLVKDNFRQGALVALKRMSDAAFGQRLEVEFHRLADMRHPNLARAYDFSRDDEGPFFTSEFVDGTDIVSWSKRADEKSVVLSMASLLRALALIHDRDLVHGDLSPGNVLIT